MNPLRRYGITLVALGLSIAPVARAQGNAAASPSAKEHFAAGVAHVQDPSGPRYEEGYREFKAAYAESPLHTIALNIGYCAFFLERDLEALEMYELYLSKAGESEISRAQRTQLEKDIQALKAGLVRVSLKVSPTTATLIDERLPTKGNAVINRYPIKNGSARLGIHPGTHRFTIVAEGHQPQTWEFEAQPASSHTHDFHLARNAGPSTASVAPKGTVEVIEPKSSPLLYGSAVATGVFAVGAVLAGVLANAKKSDFDAINDGTQVSRAEELRETTKAYALVSDICLGAAVISAGAAAYFFFGDKPQSISQPRKARWSIAPSLGATRASIELSGSF